MTALWFASWIASEELLSEITTTTALYLFLSAFILRMQSGAFKWKRALLIADAVSWSTVLGRSMLSSLIKIRHLSALHDPDDGVRPGPAGAS